MERRVLRDRSNPFHLPEYQFINMFRLTRHAALTLLNQINPYMEHQRGTISNCAKVRERKGK